MLIWTKLHKLSNYHEHSNYHELSTFIKYKKSFSFSTETLKLIQFASKLSAEKKLPNFICYSNSLVNFRLECSRLFAHVFHILPDQNNLNFSCMVMAINLQRMRSCRKEKLMYIYINYWFILMVICLCLVQGKEKEGNVVNARETKRIKRYQSHVNRFSSFDETCWKIVLLLLQLYLQIASLLLNSSSAMSKNNLEFVIRNKLSWRDKTDSENTRQNNEIMQHHSMKMTGRKFLWKTSQV